MSGTPNTLFGIVLINLSKDCFCIIFPDDTRKIILVRCFWKDYLFRTFGNKNMFFRAVLVQIFKSFHQHGTVEKEKMTRFIILHRNRGGVNSESWRLLPNFLF